MTIEIVFNETFENVETALHGAMGDCGFKVSPAPMSAGVEVKSKMAFWLGEKGNGLLSLFLPWIFKTDTVSAVLAAYVDGTTSLVLRENSTHGGSYAGGASRVAGGMLQKMGPAGALTSYAATAATDSTVAKADADNKATALAKQLAAIEEKLRTRLAGKIAYEGPARPDVQPVSI